MPLGLNCVQEGRATGYYDGDPPPHSCTPFESRIYAFPVNRPPLVSASFVQTTYAFGMTSAHMQGLLRTSAVRAADVGSLSDAAGWLQVGRVILRLKGPERAPSSQRLYMTSFSLSH